MTFMVGLDGKAAILGGLRATVNAPWAARHPAYRAPLAAQPGRS